MFSLWEMLATVTLIWTALVAWEFVMTWREYNEYRRVWGRVSGKKYLAGELAIALVLIFLTYWYY